MTIGARRDYQWKLLRADDEASEASCFNAGVDVAFARGKIEGPDELGHVDNLARG